jgi:hypothetical protein
LQEEVVLSRILTCAVCLLALTAAPALADPLVAIRAGEWVSTMQMGDSPPGSATALKICYTTDRNFSETDLNRPLPGADCHSTVNRSGQVLNIQTHCAIDKMQFTTNQVMTIVSDDEFAVNSVTHIENGPAKMPSDMTMSIHWLHTGPCQPGDRPAPEPPKP